MKLVWFIIPVAIATLSRTFAQQSMDPPATKLGTIIVPAGSLQSTSEARQNAVMHHPSTPTAFRNGFVPPDERRLLQKPPRPPSPEGLIGASGPLPPSHGGQVRKARPQSGALLPGTLDITATIYDALWDNEVDYDNDGYKQSARLVWDPDVVGSAGSLDVYEKIYRKVYTSRFWGLVTTTSPHTITGTSDSDKYFVQVNSTAHDLFDWRIDIYRAGQSTADYSRDPSNDPDLDNYPLETPDEDAIARIFDAWWTNEMDFDGDGYKSSARLVWDPDVAGSTGSLTVHEVISMKYCADPVWSLYSQTLPHIITGNSSDDSSFIDFAPFYSKTAMFDFKIDIYREGNSSADDTQDPSNDADLNDYCIEASPLDGLRARIAEVWWSGNVDNDGDGYRQSTWLHWDPDIVTGNGYLLVDCRIFWKASGSSQWQPQLERFSLLRGDTRADADSIHVSNLPHGLYDWKIEVYSDWNSAPDFVRDPSNEPLLGSLRMELLDEDGTTAVEQLSYVLPLEFALMQNYPNPFNPKTGIRYEVSGVSDVNLAVYDILGRKVAVLVNERKAPGRYEVSFDGTGLASGVYIYRLTAGSFVATKRMLCVK